MKTSRALLCVCLFAFPQSKLGRLPIADLNEALDLFLKTAQPLGTRFGFPYMICTHLRNVMTDQALQSQMT